ncbi:MAG: bifunctional phosphoribosyl-AMP cyclohydrolase/phosphoribosyl-ATP diphosphatase HisIE [Campylobacterales bacterium]|nr:bifunctional phosphoribosyl-AMP cyclohydrolase/phosphoribosyl-ATP diphosphatase HisIE [Campylobacterales bacterium]
MIDIINWEKSSLLPAIVQDSKSNEVLMLAYMNKEAYELTISTKFAHYFSRSKQRIWKKGEESGNTQIVKEILLDCDSDTILLKVEQVGGVSCHTGRVSCFYKNVLTNEHVTEPTQNMNDKYSITDRLYHVLLERKNSSPEVSYTSKLFHKGENSILKKVAEECAEFCFAVKDNSTDEIIYECADIVYHVLVALAYKDINPDRVKKELERRFGLSGIEEKNSRNG